ncbi:unnamed protein product [Effrenium voratum]|nr:unnamed protein product [Effrenium voratum]
MWGQIAHSCNGSRTAASPPWLKHFTPARLDAHRELRAKSPASFMNGFKLLCCILTKAALCNAETCISGCMAQADSMSRFLHLGLGNLATPGSGGQPDEQLRAASLLQRLPYPNQTAVRANIGAAARNASRAAKNATEAAAKEAAKAMEWKQDFVRLQSGGEATLQAPMTAQAISGMVMNLITCSACVILFGALRVRYAGVRGLAMPCVWLMRSLSDCSAQVYAGNVPSEVQPASNWVVSALHVDSDMVASSKGLDACMAIEYASFGFRLSAALGLPLVILLSPLHHWYGGKGLVETDFLASLSMSNIKPGHPWLYHLHGVVACGVVLLARAMIFGWQEEFMKRRNAWLRDLPWPRASTVLVEGIPDSFRCQERVQKFFNHFSPESVVHVSMVRHTDTLDSLMAARDAIGAKLDEARRQFGDGVRPVLDMSGTQLDAIDHFEAQLAEEDAYVEKERHRIRQASSVTGGVNTSSAFVTFRSRRDAEIAKAVQFSDDAGEWAIRDAPEASAIRWQDVSREHGALRSAIGCTIILLMYASFSPICLEISRAALAVDIGWLQPLWAALAPTLGLTIFLAMLPTVLLLVFATFFTLRAESFAQHRLQIWYYSFLFLFVLVMPVLGTNFRHFAQEVYRSPAEVFGLLADRIPLASQFFFNYEVLQWSVACMELLRLAVLVKFLLFRSIQSEAEALKKAEPEDQDFYGMGGRMARWNLNLVIGCIFCSVAPLVTLAVVAKFAVQRVAYGYLLVFAETRKPDLGGEFWCESMTQLLYGIVLYAVTMCGILTRESSSCVPSIIAAFSLALAVATLVQFKSRFRWQTLAFAEVIHMEPFLKVPVKTEKLGEVASYEQPALRT